MLSLTVLVNAEGRLDHIDSQRLGDLLRDGAPCRFQVQPHLPAQETARVEIAKNKIRIGDGRIPYHPARNRLGPARRLALSGPTWMRPMPSILAIEPPPAPDLDHVDHGNLEGQTAALL